MASTPAVDGAQPQFASAPESNFRETKDTEIIKAGYLQKKGQLFKGWKKRWFTCDGRTLKYYISSSDTRPNGAIDLAACTVQDGGLSETWNSPRIYLSDSNTGTMYCLSSEVGNEVKEWLTVLTNAINKLHGIQVEPIQSFDTEEVRRRIPGQRKPQGGRNVAGSISLSAPAGASVQLGPSPGHIGVSPQRLQHRKSNAVNGNFVRKMKKLSATNANVEQDLIAASQVADAILKQRNGWTLVASRRGVRIFDGRSPEGHELIKSSVVLDAPPDALSRLISDVSRRHQWDPVFSSSSLVKSLGANTEIAYYAGRLVWGKKPPLLLDGSPLAAVLVSAILFLGISHLLPLMDKPTAAAVSLVGGFVMAHLDISAWLQPRDLLVVKHVREHASSASYIILERSISLPDEGTDHGVRAHTGATIYLIEPLHSIYYTKSLVTFITDIDPRGYLPPSLKNTFRRQRAESLSFLRDYVEELLASSDTLGYGDDGATEEVESEVGVTEDLDIDSRDWMRGMVRVATGGLKFTDKDQLKKQKGVLLDVLKSFGSDVLSGKTAVSLSLPVRIFEPHSMLERIADCWLYAPTFLTRASKPGTDPVERLKLVMCFAVSGLHFGVGQLKPFNPILGETYQTKFADGTEIYMEHTSHHPPISNYQVVNGSAGYLLWGYVILGGSFKGNAVLSTQTGPSYVDFSDGTRISYNLPTMKISGVLWGDRTVELQGTMLFEDQKNNLRCELRFNPYENKGYSSMWAAAKSPSDTVAGSIVRTDSGDEICQVSGSWLEELAFNGEKYWSMDREKATNFVRPSDDEVLPSDCRFREDVQLLAKKDEDAAQEAKLRLEKLQRADRNKRKDGRRHNHWANSSESGH